MTRYGSSIASLILLKVFLVILPLSISDNLKFHGHVGNRGNIASRNLKQLVGKIENYIDFLKNKNEELEEKYTQRVTSRIIGNYVSLLFIGKDIRQIKNNF